MRGSSWFRTLLAGAAFLPLLSSSLRADTPPFNIVILLIDTLAAEHLETYGYQRETAPFLSGFARENIVFENTFSQAAWTLPSHFSLFTGVYPETHGVVELKTANALSPALKTIAQYAKASGYRTVWAGTRPNSFLDHSRGLGRGFDEIQALDAWADPIDVHMLRLKALLGGLARERFFLFLHTYRVHVPYAPAPEHRRLFPPFPKEGVVLERNALLELKPRRVTEFEGSKGANNFFSQFDTGDSQDRATLVSLYDGAIRSADDKIAVVVAHLKKLGIYDQTLLIITSDHGEAFGEHGHFSHSVATREELHIPLIVKMPRGALGAGHKRIKETALSIDVLPTVLDLMGLPVAPSIEGRSLLPLITGKPLRRDGYFYAYSSGSTTDTLWNQEWKLLDWLGHGRLYHVSEDPYERSDLSASQPGMVSRMRGALNAFILQRARAH